MSVVSRKINWISSLEQDKSILDLEHALTEFYSNHNTYFSDIDFTSENWVKKTEHGYERIVQLVAGHQAICEIGCGNANILKHYPEFAAKYTGLDFSEELQNKNSGKYPDARFLTFKTANTFPVAEEQFDFVFSVFVLYRDSL